MYQNPLLPETNKCNQKPNSWIPQTPDPPPHSTLFRLLLAHGTDPQQATIPPTKATQNGCSTRVPRAGVTVAVETAPPQYPWRR